MSQDVVIQEKDNIRLRIVGTRVDANDIVSLHYTRKMKIIFRYKRGNIGMVYIKQEEDKTGMDGCMLPW